jgi:hypothetical protein
MTSNDCIEIDDSVEIIERDDLRGFESLREVRFSFGNHLHEIDDIKKCRSLCRIEIPSSV